MSSRERVKYKRALDINPKLSQAYNNWGLCLNDLEKYLEAAYKFEKAIELNPLNIQKTPEV